MKKIAFFTFFATLLAFTNAQSQNFKDFLDQFAAIESNLVWVDADVLANMRAPRTKPLNAAQSTYVSDGLTNRAYYPMGKIQIGGNWIVFVYSPVDGYKEGFDTQIAIHAYAFDKDGNEAKGGYGRTSYLAAMGGVPDKFWYKFKATFVFDKKELTIKQEASDPGMESEITYSLTKKGLITKTVKN